MLERKKSQKLHTICQVLAILSLVEVARERQRRSNFRTLARKKWLRKRETVAIGKILFESKGMIAMQARKKGRGDPSRTDEKKSIRGKGAEECHSDPL